MERKSNPRDDHDGRCVCVCHQPLVYAALDRNVKDQYVNMFGHKYARTLMQASAGCVMGIGEVALLPLDVLKIKAQTNPESI